MLHISSHILSLTSDISEKKDKLMTLMSLRRCADCVRGCYKHMVVGLFSRVVSRFMLAFSALADRSVVNALCL